MSESYSRRQTLKFMTLMGAGISSASRVWAEPLPLARESKLCFLALGDWGATDPAGQKAVAGKIADVAKDQPADFVISLGDNFYPRGVTGVEDPRWQVSFEDVYAAEPFQKPWHPVLGNHDRRGDVMAQVAYSQKSKRWTMPAKYYVASKALSDGTIVDLFFIDTTPIDEDYAILRQLLPSRNEYDQLSWLDQSLAASRARWKIVVGHHPVFSNGPHGSTPALIANVKPLLEKHGVAAYLSGHDHNLQHIVSNNIHYIICGSSATSTSSSGSTIDGTVFAKDNTLGFLRAAVSKAVLRVDIFDVTGAVLHTVSIAKTGSIHDGRAMGRRTSSGPARAADLNTYVPEHPIQPMLAR